MKFDKEFIRLMAVKLRCDIVNLVDEKSENIYHHVDVLGVTMTINLRRSGNHREFTVWHEGQTVGIAKLVGDFGATPSEVYTKWCEDTEMYLRRQLAKWIVDIYAKTDAEFRLWRVDMLSAIENNTIIHGEFWFTANAGYNGGYLTVLHKGKKVYEIKRINNLGMTTQEGWQNFNDNNIVSEFKRVVVHLLTTSEHDYALPVEHKLMA